MDRHKLHNIGAALYGVPFRSTLAGALGAGLGDIEAMLDGSEPVSDVVAARATALVEGKISDLQALL